MTQSRSARQRALAISVALGALLLLGMIVALPSAWMMNWMIANAPELRPEQMAALSRFRGVVLIYWPLQGVCALPMTFAALRARNGSDRANLVLRLCLVAQILVWCLFAIDPDHGWKAYRSFGQSLFIDAPPLFRHLMNAVTLLSPPSVTIFYLWLLMALRVRAQEIDGDGQIAGGGGTTSHFNRPE